MTLPKLNPSSRIKIIFRSFQYRNYRLFFFGQSISLIGTWMQRIALPWLVYQISGSVLLLGIVSFAGQIPTFIMSPFAGVFTDRWNRYHVLIVTQILAMFQAIALTVLFYSDLIKIWNIIGLSILLGTINAFDVPSRHSFVIDVVGKKEDMGNAIGLNSLMINGARLVGPSIAGILLVTEGEGVCFMINAVSYLFVIASLLVMRLDNRSTKKKDLHMFKELREGVSYALGFTPIKYLIFLLAFISLIAMPFSVLMPVFAKEILLGDSHTFGFLMGGTGIGALLVGIYLASKRTILRLGSIVPFAAGILGIGLVSLSLSRAFYLSLLLMVITGLGMMLLTASSNIVLQTVVDDDKRGRVMSFYTMAILGTAPFGSLLTGWLAKVIGAPYTILLGGIMCLTGALLFYQKLPELKRKVKSIYDKMEFNPGLVSGLYNASEPSVQNPE